MWIPILVLVLIGAVMKLYASWSYTDLYCVDLGEMIIIWECKSAIHFIKLFISVDHVQIL